VYRIRWKQEIGIEQRNLTTGTMNRLIFIRHGESEANVTATISNRDLPHALTYTGRLQATEMAHVLEPWGVQRIYSSPILRARETAQIVADVCGLEVTLVDALR
jgi:broad specificity phosphatase PhoE